jgi:hypothetical protein
MAMALAAGTGPLLVAAGKPSALLALNVATLIVYAAVIWVATPFGLTTICFAVVAHSLVWVCSLYVLMDRLLGLPVKRIVWEALPATVCTAALVATTWPATYGMEAAGVSSTLILLVAGLLGAAVYGGGLRLAFPSAWADVALIARRVVLSRRAAPVVRAATSPAAE